MATKTVYLVRGSFMKNLEGLIKLIIIIGYEA